MSARAVGAHLLRQMEVEELLEKCTLEAFERRFSALIVAELRTQRRDRYDVFNARAREYELRERLWQQWLTKTQADIDRRYDKRVAEWGDWWLVHSGYAGMTEFILDLLDKIDRRVSETYILQAQDEAYAEDFSRSLERDLTVDVPLNEELLTQWQHAATVETVEAAA